MIAVGVIRFLGRCGSPRPRGWRAVAVVALVSALSACMARSLEEPQIVPTVTDSHAGPIITNRNVDILFLVDDSPSMRLSQENLLRNFSVLMNALENMPGGL